MQQLLAVWAALDLRKQVIVIGTTLAVFAAVLGLARMAAQPSMALLYSGLEPGPAGEVIAALEARGVATDVRGGAIYVPESERDALRMTLASEGLPTNSSKGYELLDGLENGRATSHDVAIAKASASRSVAYVTMQAHQLHGGQGLIEENDLYFFSIRGKDRALAWGTAEECLAQIARDVEDSPRWL